MRSSLIWVCTVCSDLSVPIFKIITVCQSGLSSRCISTFQFVFIQPVKRIGEPKIVKSGAWKSAARVKAEGILIKFCLFCSKIYLAIKLCIKDMCLHKVLKVKH